MVVVATIPFAMLFAFLLMNITGIPASLLSLGAIDFGIIVDGAVVMVENVMRRYRDASPTDKKRELYALRWMLHPKLELKSYFPF